MQFIRDWILDVADEAGLESKTTEHLDGIVIDLRADYAFAEPVLLAQFYIPYHNKCGLILLHKVIKTNIPHIIVIGWYSVGLKGDDHGLVVETYETSPFGRSAPKEHHFRIQIGRDGCIARGYWLLGYDSCQLGSSGIMSIIPTQDHPSRLTEVFISGSLKTVSSETTRRYVETHVKSFFPFFVPLSLGDKADFSPDRSFKLIDSAKASLFVVHDSITPWVENEYRVALRMTEHSAVLINQELLQNECSEGLLTRFQDAETLIRYNKENLSDKITDWFSTTFKVPRKHLLRQPANNRGSNSRTCLDKTVLIIAANPCGMEALRISEEIREIREGLRRAQLREHFTVVHQSAARPRDIHRALLDYKPHVVHFCGHGQAARGNEPSGLVLEDEEGLPKLVSARALADLFSLFADRVECVILNACYSEALADAIAQHVRIVIGMPQAISDRSSIEFAVAFYDAIGAGQPVEFAYKLGCNALRVAGLSTHIMPAFKQHLS
ncbi:MAG: CHAT domain-containing protein [Proteobacteria bacterium]|nr:CHAT domain-containing protein [Pseudomonadota bacterium]